MIIKTKKNVQKMLMKGTKIFLKKKKTKSANIFVSDIKIFLRDRERYKNLLENETQRLVEYRNNYSKNWKNKD